MKHFLSLLANMVGPWLGYEYLHRRGWSEMHALMAVTVIPLTWGLLTLIIKRKWDPIAILSAVGMVISLAVCALASDVRALQVRDSYVTLMVGLIFLGSVAFRRPVLLWFAHIQAPEEQREALGQKFQHPEVRHTFTILTLGWGLVTVAEFAVKLWMIEVYPIETVLAVGPWVMNGMIALAVVWTLWYSARRRRLKPVELPGGLGPAPRGGEPQSK